MFLVKRYFLGTAFCSLLISSCTWIYSRVIRTEAGSVASPTVAVFPKTTSVLISSTVTLVPTVVGSTFSILGNSLGSSISSSGVFTAGTTAGTVTVQITAPTGAQTTASITIFNILTANLILWLKADALAYADGASVAAWADSSGSGNNMTGGGTAPIFRTGILNSKPVVRFNGTSSTMTGAFVPVTGASDRTVIAVITNGVGPSNSAGMRILGWGGTGSFGNTYALMFRAIAAGTDASMRGDTFAIDHWTYYDTFYPVVSYRQPNSNPTLLAAEYNGTTNRIYVNGESSGERNYTLNTSAATNFHLGFRGGGFNDQYFQGDVAEVLIWNSVLSTTDRQNVECYLALKYNLQVYSTQGCSNSTLKLKFTDTQAVKISSNYNIEAIGGTPPYSYSTTAGSVSSSGVFTAPATAGAVSVTVSDQSGQSVVQNFNVVEFARPMQWFKPEALASVYSNGQGIPIWNDSSGNGYHMYNAWTASQPTFHTNQLNGQGIARFGGAHSMRSFPSLPDAMSPRSVAAVVVNTVANGSINTIINIGPGNNTDDMFSLVANATGTFGIDRRTNFWAGSLALTAAATLIVATHDGVNNVTIRANGTGIANHTGTITTSNYAYARGIALGYRSLSNAEYFSGDLAEAMVFDVQLTASEITALETYLKTKYAIP